MKCKQVVTVLGFVLACALASTCSAQHANDSLLFIVELEEDTIGLFGCRWGQAIRNTLSGPVIMNDHTLLFFSRDGYVLYNQRGRLIDSHSLIRKNRRFARRGKPQYRLAYPLDKKTIVYYRNPEKEDGKKEIFYKRLFKHGLKAVNGATYESFESVGSAQLFNLYNNAITDEMAIKTHLMPHLVGYTSLEGGKRWWSLDKFYSFTSPIIFEEDGKYIGFFPGFGRHTSANVKKNLIEPLGVFWMNGQWCFYGAYSPHGTQQEKYFQKLFLCDQAGNLLYENSILKMTVVDDVLGENIAEKMLYTVKREARHVFLPAVDENGDIYYGIIDYKKHRIEVMKRLYYKFVPEPCAPALEQRLSYEQGFVYEVSATQCSEQKRSRSFLPRIQYMEPGGDIRAATKKDLLHKGYIAMISRKRDKGLAKTISRVHRSLPDRVQKIQDSLSHLTTAWCPYSLVLTHTKKGPLCTFDYGLGDIIISARVLGVTNTFEVVVRVDLIDCAEVVVFTTDGQFLNRFRFNSENHEVRNDLVAVSPDRVIIEKDYEIGEGAYRYYSWKLSTQPSDVRTTR